MKISPLLCFALLATVLQACQPAANSTATDKPPTPVVDPVAPTEQPAASGLKTLQGTYLTTEVGDYLHARIQGDDKVAYSFFLSEDFPEARSAEMMEGMWDGKAVKVQWRKIKRDIPEAGGFIEVEEMVSIEAI
jgi:hypothetical protein